MGHKKSSTGTVDSAVEEAYQSREFCRDVSCRVQQAIDSHQKGSEGHEQAKQECRDSCKYSRLLFMMWLTDNGYTIEGPPDDPLRRGDTAYKYHHYLQETGRKIVRAR